MGAFSTYSHTTNGSSVNLVASRPWYQKIVINLTVFLRVRHGATIAALYSVFSSILVCAVSAYDLHRYLQVTPGSAHFQSPLFDFESVYVGNNHVRNALIAFFVISIFGSFIVFITSLIFTYALSKEDEQKMLPWLYTLPVFAVFYFLDSVFGCLVNDMIYLYNIINVSEKILYTICSAFAWIYGYAFYLELSLPKLEDHSHLKGKVMSSDVWAC